MKLYCGFTGRQYYAVQEVRLEECHSRAEHTNQYGTGTANVVTAPNLTRPGDF